MPKNHFIRSWLYLRVIWYLNAYIGDIYDYNTNTLELVCSLITFFLSHDRNNYIFVQVGEIRPATVDDFKQLLDIVFIHDGWEAKPDKGQFRIIWLGVKTDVYLLIRNSF